MAKALDPLPGGHLLRTALFAGVDRSPLDGRVGVGLVPRNRGNDAIWEVSLEPPSEARLAPDPAVPIAVQRRRHPHLIWQGNFPMKARTGGSSGARRKGQCHRPTGLQVCR